MPYEMLYTHARIKSLSICVMICAHTLTQTLSLSVMRCRGVMWNASIFKPPDQPMVPLAAVTKSGVEWSGE